MTFNKVVFHRVGADERNIHIAVHPFQHGRIHMLSYKGDAGGPFSDELVDWKARLADALWDGLPGLTYLFYTNGNITLQHSGVFSDDEITTTARDIITPALEQQLGLSQMWTDTPEEPDERYQERSDTEGQEF